MKPSRRQLLAGLAALAACKDGGPVDSVPAASGPLQTDALASSLRSLFSDSALEDLARQLPLWVEELHATLLEAGLESNAAVVAGVTNDVMLPLFERGRVTLEDSPEDLTVAAHEAATTLAQAWVDLKPTMEAAQAELDGEGEAPDAEALELLQTWDATLRADVQDKGLQDEPLMAATLVAVKDGARSLWTASPDQAWADWESSAAELDALVNAQRLPEAVDCANYLFDGAVFGKWTSFFGVLGAFMGLIKPMLVAFSIYLGAGLWLWAILFGLLLAGMVALMLWRLVEAAKSTHGKIQDCAEVVCP